MTRQRRLCAACDRVLPLWVRADKRACNGTCRMRVSRMRRGARSPLAPRSYSDRQPIPRKHQSPALLRIAGVQHARAEQAEQERRNWQQRYEEQAAELVQLRRELADQKRTATEQERRQSEETKRLRQELSDKQDDSQAELADAQQQIAELAEERDVLRELLTECEISRDELQRERDEKEEEVSSLQEKLGQAEQAHKEVSAVAESQRRTIRHERQRREELEKQLDKALKPPKIPAQDTEIKTSESAWALYQRAEQLAEENRSLRRQRDEVAHERERISNRILRLMSPGQYSQYAATAGYDPTNDSLILWKTDELRVLDQYSRWQKLYRTRVTARKMKEQRPLDEQAIEAALSDRWKLMTKPLKKLGKQPEWRIVGFLLDEESELFLAKESRDRARRTVRMMQRE